MSEKCVIRLLYYLPMERMSNFINAEVEELREHLKKYYDETIYLEEENKKLKERIDELEKCNLNLQERLDRKEEVNKKMREELSAYDREYFDEDKKAEHIFMEEDTLQELRDLGEI